ncbi:hypothetical protein [Halostella litorea]|uniref:hypothetical protein n=1 Tax=Halostella litorea TaxID=2528831 RepID=UPI0010929EF2|nr:hypothetical protein [Halostella litorea]
MRKSIQRRTFLASSSAALLAGCISDDEDADTTQNGGGDQGNNFNGGGESGGGSNNPDTTESVQTNTLVDDTVDVSEDEYRYWTFTLNQEATLSYEFTVRNGPNVDVILTDQEEFNSYQDGNRFRYASSGSSLDSIGDRISTDIPADDYVLCIDNTEAGEAQPPSNLDDDVARVEIMAVIES